jgi:1-acyl-sn-glycerol-3-phosphate acyltransferase
MNLVRSLLFNVAFYGWTTICGAVFVPTFVLPRPVLRACLIIWARGIRWQLATIVGLTAEFRGTGNLPAGPVVLCAKHQSAWETIMFIEYLADPVYVVKKELLRIPLYGWCAWKANSIAVDRQGGGSALKAMVAGVREALAAGRQVVIFPEGTRTEVGARQPYHPGIAAIAAKVDAPVVPVALNSGLFWGRRSFVKRPGRIIVEFLPAMPSGMRSRAFMQELEHRIETASAALIAESPVDNSVD